MKTRLVSLVVLCAGLVIAACMPGAYAQPGGKPKPRPSVGYASVKGIFEKNCTRCHGTEKAREGLRLHTYKDVMAGGEHGPIVVAGKPAQSLLIRSVKGQGVKRMPPKGPALTAADIKTLEAWVAAGAREK